MTEPHGAPARHGSADSERPGRPAAAAGPGAAAETPVEEPVLPSPDEARPENPATADAAASVEADVAALRQTLSDAEDRYLRLAADFENFKRRKAQELNDGARYASEHAARALLPVLDNLRRAVDHAPDAGVEDFYVNGLRLVVREFETALERLGVHQVPAVGEPFDPAIHEAIGGEESDEVGQDTVTAELVPGYRLHDRLLRPAVVRVAHPRQAPSRF